MREDKVLSNSIANSAKFIGDKIKKDQYVFPKSINSLSPEQRKSMQDKREQHNKKSKQGLVLNAMMGVALMATFMTMYYYSSSIEKLIF